MRSGSVDEALTAGPSVSRVDMSSLANQRIAPRLALKAPTLVVAGLSTKVAMSKGIAPSGRAIRS